jgi:antirestriction protein
MEQEHQRQDGSERADTDHERGHRPETPEPRIYVASIHDFNFGIQHGIWLDADQEPDELRQAISTMLAASPIAKELHQPTDEWIIQHYDGFGQLVLGEYESLETIVRLADGINRHGEPFIHWASYVGIERTEDLERFNQAFVGHWETLEAFADHVLDDLGAPTYIANAPESYRRHLRLDRQTMAQELETQLYIAVGSDGIYVYDPND